MQLEHLTDREILIILVEKSEAHEKKHEQEKISCIDRHSKIDKEIEGNGKKGIKQHLTDIFKRIDLIERDLKWAFGFATICGGVIFALAQLAIRAYYGN